MIDQSINKKVSSAFLNEQIEQIQTFLQGRMITFTQQQINRQIQDFILKSILSQSGDSIKQEEFKNCHQSEEESYHNLANCALKVIYRLEFLKQQIEKQYQTKFRQTASLKELQILKLNQKISSISEIYAAKCNNLAIQIEALKYQKAQIMFEKQQQARKAEKKINQLQKKLSTIKINLQKQDFLKSQQNSQRQQINEFEQIQMIIKDQNQYLAKRLNQLELYNILQFEIEEFHDTQRVRKTYDMMQKQQYNILTMAKLQSLIQSYPTYEQFDQKIEIFNSESTIEQFQQLKSSQKQYEELSQRQIIKLSKSIKQLKSQKLNIEKLLAQHIKQSSSACQIKDKQISSLSKQITLLSKQISTLKASVNDYSAQNDSLKAEVKQNYEHISQKKIRIEQLSLQLQQLREYKDKFQKVRQELQQMNTNNQNLNIQIYSLKETIQTIRSIKSQNHQKQIVEQMIEKSYLTRIQNKQQKQQIKRLKLQIQAHQQLSCQLKQTLQTYRAKDQELETVIERLRYELQMVNKKIMPKQNITKKLKIQSQKNQESELSVNKNEQYLNQQQNLLKDDSKNYDQSVCLNPKVNESSICSDSESIIQCKCHPRRPMQKEKQNQFHNYHKQNDKCTQNIPFETSFNKNPQIKKHPILKKLEIMSFTEDKKHKKCDIIEVNQFEQNKENIVNHQKNLEFQNKIEADCASNFNQSNDRGRIKDQQISQQQSNVHLQNKQTQRYKYKVPQKQRGRYLQKELERYKKNINDMNEIVNYIVNYIKGYTRNGIRSKCWIVSQGQKYLKRAIMSENVKLKYENFEKIRGLCSEDRNCRQLIKNFQKIMNYYFQ